MTLLLHLTMFMNKIYDQFSVITRHKYENYARFIILFISIVTQSDHVIKK